MTAFAALTAATIRMAAPSAAMHEVMPVMTRPEIAVTAEMPDMASTIKMAPPVMAAGSRGGNGDDGGNRSG